MWPVAVVAGAADLDMVVQRSHARGIAGVAFLPGGAGIVDASDDLTVHVRKLDGRLVRVMRTGFGAWCMALSPDGQNLLVGGQSEDVQLWRVRDGQLLRTFKGNKGAVTGVAFSPDGQLVASSSAYKNGFIWRISGQQVAELTGHTASLHAVAFSPDSHQLVTGDEQGFIRLWGTDGRPMGSWRADEGAINTLTFRPDGKALAIATRRIHDYGAHPGERGQNRLRLFDRDGKSLQTLVERDVRGLRYARDGRLLGAGGDEVSLWDPNGKLVRTFQVRGEPRAWPTSVDISSDGALVVAASHDLPSIRTWTIDGRLQLQILEHPAELAAVAYARDGSMFATAGWNGKIALWTSTGKLMASLDGGNGLVQGLAFSPDGQHLASAGQFLRVFSRTGQTERTLGSSSAMATRVTFGPDGRELACARDDGRIEIWNVETGKQVREWKAHQGRVEAMALSPDGATLATGSTFGQLILWSWNGQRQGELRDHGRYDIVAGIAFSPDGKLIASASTNKVLVHSREGAQIRTLKTKHAWSNMDDVAFSPDGKLLATPENETIRLWDMATGKDSVLSGHAALVQALTFDPSGARLLSASSDTSARIWNLSNGAAMILLSRDSEWISASPDGMFDASPHGGSLVVMARGLDAWGIDQFAPYNNRPDVLLSRLGLGTPELVAHYQRQVQRRLRVLGLQDNGRMPTDAPDAEIVTAHVSGKTVKLKVRCRDQANLRRADVFVNDVPLPAAARTLNSREQTFETDVELTTGDNKIEASCTNARGIESFRAMTTVRYERPTRGELYFLGLGVSKYRNQALDLQFADGDATELAARFGQMGKGFSQVHVKTLTNADCTVAGMTAAKEWLRQSKVDDTVVLFVAGHGVHDKDSDETYYYLTHETNLDRLAGSAAPFDLLEDMLVSAPARRKLALMDTCESGERDRDEGATTVAAGPNVISRGLRRAVAGKPRPYIYERDRFIYNNLQRRSGAIVLSSSRGGEASYESAEFKHGFFTAAILRALGDRQVDRNRDGQVSTDELALYVGKLVPTLSGGLQQPTVDRDNLAQRFAFPLDRGSSVAVEHNVEAAPSALDSAPSMAAPAAPVEEGDAGLAAKKAVDTGDLEAVQRLVPRQVPADWSKGDGWTLVMSAAYKGRTEVLKYLLAHKGNPNAELPSGYTSLMQACRWGYVDAAKMLIDAGADVNRVSDRTGSALHITISEGKGNMEIVRALLAKRARLDARDKRGRTPIILAAEHGLTEVMTVLLDAKADVNAQDERGLSGLDYAAMHGEEAPVRLLLDRGAQVNHKNEMGMTALFHAAHGGYAPLVREFLARGADPDPVETKYGDSALMRAAQAGHRDVVALLLAKRAKPNWANKEGLTALHLAAQNGQDAVVTMLLDAGADANAVDKKGHDAASLAGRRSHTVELIRARQR